MFLYKVEANVSLMHVEASVRKFLDKFFKEYNLPMPRIKIVDRMSAAWLGRDIYRPSIDKNNTTMEIQKSITNDEKTLDRVIAHELIHHWDFVTRYGHPETGQAAWDKHLELKKFRLQPDSHGKDFKEWAEKINSVMGKDYVTKESDTSYVVEVTKDYFMLVMPTRKGADSYGWSWTLRPSPEQKAVIQTKLEEGGKLFTSRDKRWMTGVKIKQYGGMSIPMKEDSKKALKELYDSGKAIKPNWPKVITKISDFHKRMTEHYGPEMTEILKNDPLGVLK